MDIFQAFFFWEFLGGGSTYANVCREQHEHRRNLTFMHYGGGRGEALETMIHAPAFESKLIMD